MIPCLIAETRVVAASLADVSTFFIGLNVFDKILSYFLSVMAQYLLPLDCFSCSRLYHRCHG